MHGPLHICVRAALLMRFVAVLFCGGVCAALGAENSGSLRPNFLVIVTDDQRPDTIHALGNPVISTPNLDRLVRQGMTFTRAIAPIRFACPAGRRS